MYTTIFPAPGIRPYSSRSSSGTRISDRYSSSDISGSGSYIDHGLVGAVVCLVVLIVLHVVAAFVLPVVPVGAVVLAVVGAVVVPPQSISSG